MDCHTSMFCPRGVLSAGLDGFLTAPSLRSHEVREALARQGIRPHSGRGYDDQEGTVTRASLRHHLLAEDGWRPFAWSAGMTLLVAGIHTGAIDAVMLTLIHLQQLG
jgi:hypothetical protein